MEETLSAPKLNEGRGPVYRIEDESLRDLRSKLGRKREKVIFVTASGGVDPRAYRVFDGDQMDALILTTKAGAARLQGRIGPERLIIAGEDKTIDLPAAMRMLRKEMGVEHLLCEGGPTLYGSMARAGLIDEKFVTVSPVEIGLLVPPEQDITPAGDGHSTQCAANHVYVSRLHQGNAPWWRWMSCRRVGDHSSIAIGKKSLTTDYTDNTDRKADRTSRTYTHPVLIGSGCLSKNRVAMDQNTVMHRI